MNMIFKRTTIMLVSAMMLCGAAPVIANADTAPQPAYASEQQMPVTHMRVKGINEGVEIHTQAHNLWSFHVDVSTDRSFSNIVKKGDYAGDVYFFKGLKPNRTYYVRAYGVNAGEKGSKYAVKSFKTKGTVVKGKKLSTKAGARRYITRKMNARASGITFYMKKRHKSSYFTKQHPYNGDTWSAMNFSMTRRRKVRGTNGTWYRYEFDPTYNLKAGQQRRMVTGLNAAARYVNQGKSRAQKVTRCDRWLSAHCHYDEFVERGGSQRFFDYTEYGPLVKGVSVCQGYSEAETMVLRKCGVPTVVIAGYGNGGPHAWNASRINGRWLRTDTTWNDSGRTGRWLMKSKAYFENNQHQEIGVSDYYHF